MIQSPWVCDSNHTHSLASFQWSGLYDQRALHLTEAAYRFRNGAPTRGKEWFLSPFVLHCKNAKVVLTQFGYITFLLIVCIIKHSEVQLPALDSKQIKNLIWFSRSLVNVMGE